ncbi:pentalenene oxygenase [Deinobacterium chartae]|uniref:Pentalenene oxygenase n=1 Tax=Deinobacterium chartae TaxID=521158 RepID=A0A841HZA9_9DEIO|nr:cytochrome P450 [Deinobacterium chartae]MBB6097328.1 pentalenene oxygenase [Deinobacterium chartae]
MHPSPDLARPLPLLGHAPAFARDPLALLGACAGNGDLLTLRLGMHKVYVAGHPYLVERVWQTDAAHYGPSRLFERIGPLLPSGETSGAVRTRGFQTALLEETLRRGSERIRCWRPHTTLDLAAALKQLVLEAVARALFEAPEESRLGPAELHPLLGGLEVLLGCPAALAFTASQPNAAQRRLLTSLRELERASERLERQGNGLAAQLRADGLEGSALRAALRPLLLEAAGVCVSTLTFTVHAVSGLRSLEARLLEELGNLPGGTPNARSLIRLPLAERVLLESLRLYPPVWTVARSVRSGETWLAGVRLERGSSVLLPAWLLGRDARHFPQPARFDPDRWTEGAPAPPDHTFFPLGQLGRPDPLRNPALGCAVLLALEVLRHWRLEPLEALRLESALVLRPRGSLRVRLHPR